MMQQVLLDVSPEETIRVDMVDIKFVFDKTTRMLLMEKCYFSCVGDFFTRVGLIIPPVNQRGVHLTVLNFIIL